MRSATVRAERLCRPSSSVSRKAVHLKTLSSHLFYVYLAHITDLAARRLLPCKFTHTFKQGHAHPRDLSAPFHIDREHAPCNTPWPAGTLLCPWCQHIRTRALPRPSAVSCQRQTICHPLKFNPLCPPHLDPCKASPWMGTRLLVSISIAYAPAFAPATLTLRTLPIYSSHDESTPSSDDPALRLTRQTRE